MVIGVLFLISKWQLRRTMLVKLLKIIGNTVCFHCELAILVMNPI